MGESVNTDFCPCYMEIAIPRRNASLPASAFLPGYPYVLDSYLFLGTKTKGTQIYDRTFNQAIFCTCFPSNFWISP